MKKFKFTNIYLFMIVFFILILSACTPDTVVEESNEVEAAENNEGKLEELESEVEKFAELSEDMMLLAILTEIKHQNYRKRIGINFSDNNLIMIIPGTGVTIDETSNGEVEFLTNRGMMEAAYSIYEGKVTVRYIYYPHADKYLYVEGEA